MASSDFRLTNPPIAEAVIDIDCALPPNFEPSEIESAAVDAFTADYPRKKRIMIQHHEVRQTGGEAPEFSVAQAIQGYQFLTADERQLVQVKRNGFSFNRLPPYTSLDDYLPVIRDAWTRYARLAKPAQVRRVAVRFINRILLPTDADHRVELADYLRISPRLPNEETLDFVGFMNQHSAIEIATGNLANIILFMQPLEGDRLPLILDIEAQRPASLEPDDWSGIEERLRDLRRLKNEIFRGTLTERCLSLFQ